MNHWVETFRDRSYILNPKMQSMSDNVIEGDRSSIKSNLLRIRGSDDNPGYFYDTGSHSWRMCRIMQIKTEIRAVEEKFRRYREQKINSGHAPPEKYPPELAEERDKLKAKLQVHQEEVKRLEMLLEKAPNPHVERQKIKHPKHWSTGSFRNGILAEIGGIRVSPDQDGLLRISDERSEYNGMSVADFRSRIVNPMYKEHHLRERLELAEAKAEGRIYMRPKWPPPGTWDPKKNYVEYDSSYHPEILRKLKKPSQ